MSNNENNTGSWNSGSWNSGNRNSGYGNSGYGNSGSWNSGNRNSGNRNSGNRNSGSWNTGYGNSTKRSAGIFCTIEPEIISFNKPTNKKFDEIDHPHFDEFYLNKWISDSEMSDREKEDNSPFRTCLGYLKTFTYEEAWANFWRDTPEENKQKFLSLPNFDADIFLEITNIDVRKKENTCEGKEVEIDGKVYVLKLKD